MVASRNWKRPPAGTATKLRKETGGIKPRLTFVFPLAESTRTAMRVLQSESPKPREVETLLESKTDAELLAGLNALKRMPKESKEKIARLPEKLRELIAHNDSEVRKESGMQLAKYPKTTRSDLRKLLEHGSHEVQEQAVTELAKRPQTTQDDLKELLKHESWVVNKQAGIELAKHPKTTKEYLNKLLNHESMGAQEQAVIELAKQPQTTQNDLKELLKHEHRAVQKQAVIELEKRPQTTMDDLRELLKHESDAVQEQAVIELAKQPQTTQDDLKEMLNNKSWSVRKQTAIELAKRWQTGEDDLRSLLKHGNIEMQKEALIELAKRSQITEDELRELLNDKQPEIREQAITELANRSARLELLTSGKPLFATPFSKELSLRIKKLEEMASILKTKYRKAFTGIVVVGSTSKGYFEPKSDLDYTVITSKKKAAKEFRKLAEANKFKLDGKARVVNPSSSLHFDFLFNGLFFGDRHSLEQEQAKAVEKVSNEEWDSIRKNIETKEADIDKISNRFQLPKEEIERIKIANRLLRVPPALEEMREIMRRRMRRREGI